MTALHRHLRVLSERNSNIGTGVMDATAALDTALDKVRSTSASCTRCSHTIPRVSSTLSCTQVARLQENVSQAVLPGGGGQSVQYLGVSCCLLLLLASAIAGHVRLLDHASDHIIVVTRDMAPNYGCCRAVLLLQAAEQNVRQLQQLSEQLQQLAAAVQAATPPVTQPTRDQHEAWATGLQDQAKQAAAALQQQVTTALSGPCPVLLCPPQQHQHNHTHTGKLNCLLWFARLYTLLVRPQQLNEVGQL
jgi:hypothetical protein